MKIQINYYALLREERGVSSETLTTDAKTARDLYNELQAKHKFRLGTDKLRVAINNEFSDWSRALAEGDSIMFIPPVAGG